MPPWKRGSRHDGQHPCQPRTAVRLVSGRPRWLPLVFAEKSGRLSGHTVVDFKWWPNRSTLERQTPRPHRHRRGLLALLQRYRHLAAKPTGRARRSHHPLFQAGETVSLRIVQAVALVPDDFGAVCQIVPHGEGAVCIEGDSVRKIIVPVDWSFVATPPDF